MPRRETSRRSNRGKGKALSSQWLLNPFLSRAFSPRRVGGHQSIKGFACAPGRLDRFVNCLRALGVFSDRASASRLQGKSQPAPLAPDWPRPRGGLAVHVRELHPQDSGAGTLMPALATSPSPLARRAEDPEVSVFCFLEKQKPLDPRGLMAARMTSVG
jgi:hypothetical protein